MEATSEASDSVCEAPAVCISLRNGVSIGFLLNNEMVRMTPREAIRFAKDILEKVEIVTGEEQV